MHISTWCVGSTVLKADHTSGEYAHRRRAKRVFVNVFNVLFYQIGENEAA